MDQFKQIVMRKAKIISELKYPQRSNREATLKYLKNIKKQQKQSELHDLQVLKSLSNLNFEHKQLFEKVYFLSFTIMKGLCKNFQFIPKQRETFANIVEMHYKFYVKEGALDKAQEIRLAFRKKTFQKDFFVKNLLSWLYDWGKRKLDKFLNKNILSIEKDSLADRLQSPKKLTQSVQSVQKTTTVRNSIFQGSLMNISYTQKLWKFEKPQQKSSLKIVINRNNNLFTPQKDHFEIGPSASNQITEEQEESIMEPLSQRLQTSFEPQRSNELSPGNLLLKHRSRSYNIDYTDKNSAVSRNLNKQIFYGTFWKEMNQMYRNFSCLEDLDFYYLKTFKKQKEDRKEELSKNRIDEIVDFVIKSMPKIKKSVETYQLDYAKYCPNDIKEFHTESSKILEEENRKKLLLKNISFKKSQKESVFQLRGKLKSEENLNPTECPQKMTKKTAIYRARQRNKSLNDSMLRKSTQQKVQMQVKLPIVYNPEHLYNMVESNAQKALAIHQKFQKFIVNGIRPNKGLARYKHLNKERQKNHESKDLDQDKVGLSESSNIENKKMHEYEVANIRKILRKRQKDRMSVNKTPIQQQNKEDEIIDKIMLHIKVMETKYDNGFDMNKKVDKFDIFLSNFKNEESSIFGLRSSIKSTNFGNMKNNQQKTRLDFKSFKDDFLPKIS